MARAAEARRGRYGTTRAAAPAQSGAAAASRPGTAPRRRDRQRGREPIPDARDRRRVCVGVSDFNR